MHPKRILVLLLAVGAAGCATADPQPAAAPAALVQEMPPDTRSHSIEYQVPRLSARARCFESRGAWRPTSYVCEGTSP
jgi:hypothetical protein